MIHISPLESTTLNALGFDASELSETQILKNPGVQSSKVHHLVTLVQPRSKTILCFGCSSFNDFNPLSFGFSWNDFT
jgi:hypothetical protein